jgi:hypothetical protein
MHKIGIIGQGYVGTAVKEIMSNYYEIAVQVLYQN